MAKKTKVKTNRAAKKRFTFTATGKIKRTKANRRHRFAGKTSRQKNTGKIQDAVIKSGKREKVIKQMMPYD